MRVCLYFTYTNIARIGIRFCFRYPINRVHEFIYLIYIIYITYIIYNIVCIYKAFVIFVIPSLSCFIFVTSFFPTPPPSPLCFSSFLSKTYYALRFFFVSFSSFCFQCKDNGNSNIVIVIVIVIIVLNSFRSNNK